MGKVRICKYKECTNYDKKAKTYCCNGCAFDDYDYRRLQREERENKCKKKKA
jgi:hypothetical protein